MIVLDNGSTDETSEVLAEFSKRLPIEHLPGDRPLSWTENHNRGLMFAKETDFLHFLHDDDLVVPEFYNEMVAALQPARGRALAYGICRFINDAGEEIGWDRPIRRRESMVFTRSEFIQQRIHFKPVYFPAILLKTNFQPAHCAFRPDFPQTADVVFWGEWAKQCSFICDVPRYVALYRKHSLSLTGGLSLELEKRIDEEIKTMEFLLGQLKELDGFEPGWLYREKLKYLVAARQQVMADRLRTISESNSHRIFQHIRKQLGLRYWMLGKIAVRLRDCFYPKTD